MDEGGGGWMNEEGMDGWIRWKGGWMDGWRGGEMNEGDKWVEEGWTRGGWRMRRGEMGICG